MINVWLMRQAEAHGGYFGIEAASKPLLHLWSLSIEEQFYLFWPAMICCCFPAGGDFGAGDRLGLRSVVGVQSVRDATRAVRRLLSVVEPWMGTRARRPPTWREVFALGRFPHAKASRPISERDRVELIVQPTHS